MDDFQKFWLAPKIIYTYLQDELLQTIEPNSYKLKCKEELQEILSVLHHCFRYCYHNPIYTQIRHLFYIMFDKPLH